MEFSKNNQITYNGKRYYFFALFDTADFKPVVIELKNIQLFKFENQLNQLVSSAELTFLDQYGMIDRLLLRQDVTCKIIFYEIKQKDNVDNSDAIELPNYDEYLELYFVVNNFQILNRINGDITYKAYLIHSNIIRFLQNINYTNYGNNKAKKNILNILFNCYAQAGLKFGLQAVEYNNCNINIDYITHDNDNLFTVTHYLMDKMFYYRDYEQSIKFIAYNTSTNEYEIIDLNTVDTAPEVTTCMISPFNNSNESLTTETPIQLATVVNSTLIDSYKAQVTTNFFEFNSDKNRFQQWALQNNTIRNVLNTLDATSANDKKKRFNVNLLKIDSNIQRSGNYWNNDYNIYYNLTKTLLEQNTLIINKPGVISTHLGSRCVVTIDRNKPINDQENKEKAKQEAERYKGFEGVWYIGKITFLVRPSAQDKNYFSQNLTLFRNNVEII